MHDANYTYTYILTIAHKIRNIFIPIHTQKKNTINI
jgi:hypothetical protein